MTYGDILILIVFWERIR